MRLQQIKDLFLFCCYTGLAYADIKKLERSNIIPTVTIVKSGS